MIPSNIQKHIIEAIIETDKLTIPGTSRRNFVGIRGSALSPKFIISIANRYANGVELNPNLFSGERIE